MRAGALAVAVVAGVLWSAPVAGQISIDFTGEASGAIHGRTIQGVLFEFFLSGSPSNDAAVGLTGGPGCITYVCPTLLEGHGAGTLRLTFANALSAFSFGAAANNLSSATVFVELFDAALNSLGVFDQALTPIVSFAEGLFEYDGVAIGQANITFASTSRFAIDNIEGTHAVPEPLSMLLLATGLVGVGLARRRRGQERAGGVVV